MSKVPQILIVGGNGFLGSAISKEALSRGWKVTSISQSGKPFVSPAGHQPSWSSSNSMNWKKGNANDPSTYQHLLEKSDAVVHTLGILLEGDYKGKGKDSGNLSGLGALVDGWKGEFGWEDKGNPLKKKEGKGRYEIINRDSALTVAKTFISTKSNNPLNQNSIRKPSPFIYISAEDIFRPIIPSRYIQTKREAESGILELSYQSELRFKRKLKEEEQEQEKRSKGVEISETEIPDEDGAGLTREIEDQDRNEREEDFRMIRPVFIRPGLMYHPHTRPLSTLPAAIFDLTSTINSKHLKLNLPFPTFPSILSKISSNLDPISRLFTMSPLHVDTVAKAVCQSILNENVNGPIGIDEVKRLSGWKEYKSERKEGGKEVRNGKEGPIGL